MLFGVRWVAAGLLGLGLCMSVWAQSQNRPTRIALVVANAAYSHPDDTLTGPTRDAQTIKAALEQVGFSVTVAQNVDKALLQAAVKTFHRSVRDAGPTAIAVFYYAGHGGAGQGGNENYLLPVDVPQIAKADLAAQGVGVRWITELMQTLDERRAIAIIIDACRTRAGAASGQRGSTPGGLGVAEPDEPDRGHLIAYSTSKGRPASDGGDYAQALAKRITTTGLTLDQVFEEVRLAVATDNAKQLPMFRSGLVNKVCLVNCGGEAGVDSLAVLKRAVEMRAAGDVGQVAAAAQLVREGKSLAGLDLQGLHFKGAMLHGGDLSGAELLATDFEGSTLGKANLAKAFFIFSRLRGAKLQEADATETRFYFAQADGADFSGLRGQQSNWQAATLRGANFRDAKLQGASFMMADVRDADFRGADLRGSFFIGALIAGAKFDQAQIANTDFSGAVGSARQFSREQQAGLCGTDSTRGYHYKLVRVSKSSRFASGKEYHDMFHEYAPARSGLRYLDPCTPRSLKAAGKEPIWSTRDGEQMGSSMDLHFPAELLEKAARERDILRHAKQTIDVLTAETKTGDTVSVPGKRHQGLLDALKRNVDNAKLESQARWNDDATFLYQVRYRPETITEDFWDHQARSWVSRDGNPTSRTTPSMNVWPVFFPAGTRPNELAPAHIDVFKRWTVNRARQFPARVTFEVSQSHALRAATFSMRDAAPDATSHEVVYPLVAYSTDTGGVRQYGAPLIPLLGDKANIFPHGNAAMRLRKPLNSYTVQVPRKLAPAVKNDTPGFRVQFEVTGMEVLTTVGHRLDILEGDVVDLRIQLSDGTTIP